MRKSAKSKSLTTEKRVYVPKAAEVTDTSSGKLYLCSGKCPKSKPLLIPYRIFISYSHQDSALALKLKRLLSQQGLVPITDHEIRIGESFSTEIRDMIECSHVFMPLVTKNSNRRLWVQQEIGYAAALHVPILPIAIGNLPPGMAEQIQGIHIRDIAVEETEKLLATIRKRMTFKMIDDLVQSSRRRPRQGRYYCAFEWADREELLANLTDAASRDGCSLAKQLGAKTSRFNSKVWKLRLCASFGSFSIPDMDINSEQWRVRDPNRYRTTHERQLLRRERQVMERYASCFGGDIIFNPMVLVKEAGHKPELRFKHGPEQTLIRLQLIRDFIEKHKHRDDFRIVMPPDGLPLTTNLTVVGDWFACEATIPYYSDTSGYELTTFTRHAPSVLNIMARFDQMFADYWETFMRSFTSPPQPQDIKARILKTIDGWMANLSKARETGF